MRQPLACNQLTLSWAAPIKIDAEKTRCSKGCSPDRELSPTPGSRIPTIVVPDFQTYSDLGFEEGREKGRQLLGVMVEGRVHSPYFAGKPSPLAKDEKPAEPEGQQPEAEASPAKTPPRTRIEKATITGVIEHSPESARIILIGSSSFLSDDILSLVSEVDRTQYLTPLELRTKPRRLVA